MPGKRGKEIWYETDESRVRYQRDADGRFSLTLTARQSERGSDVAVTITVGNGDAQNIPGNAPALGPILQGDDASNGEAR
jgi:hypothetical protein